MESRSTLWNKFLGLEANTSNANREESPVSKLSQDDIESLAAWNLNGREIKNIVITAQRWCSYSGLTMTLDRLKSAIKVTTPFASSIQEGEGQSISNKRRRIT